MQEQLTLTNRWINTTTGEIVDLPAPISRERYRLRQAALQAGTSRSRYRATTSSYAKTACRCADCRWWRKLRHELGWFVGLAGITAVVFLAAGTTLLP